MNMRISLNTRLSLGVVAVVLAATLAVATLALHLVKFGMQSSIASEQFARVTAIADAVDQKFVSRRTLLKTLADSMRSQAFADPEALQAFLGEHASLREAFANVAFFDTDGRLVASLNASPQMGQVSIADRTYFKETVASKAGRISQPYSNRLNGQAQVAITQPVLDRAGQLQFVISGAINLGERNFLGELADIKFGAAGYLFIITTDGIVIDHPRKSLILTQFNADGGEDSETDQALAGFEGTAEGSNRAGLRGLYSFKRIQQTPWIVGAMYPRSEAFAPIEAVTRVAWAGALALSLLAGALGLAFVRQQLRPLAELHLHMRVTQDDHASASRVPPTYAHGEIGDLSRTFDRLMQQQRASEARLRTITDNIPALVSHVDASLNYTFVNAQIRALHGSERLIGRSVAEVRGAEEFAVVEPRYRRALAGETVVFEKNGDPARGLGDRTHKAHFIPDRDAVGTVQGVFAMTFDITDEVNAQKALGVQERRLRDITDSIPALVGYFDREENCLYGNSRARQMAGVGDGTLEGVTLRSSVGDAVYAQHEPYIPSVLAGKPVRFPVHAPLRGKDGYFQVNLIPDKGVEGRVLGFYLMTFNITALKEAELRVIDSETRLRTITDNMPALITYIDRDQKITFANGTYREWLGVEPSTVVGKHIQEIAGPDLYLDRKATIERALAGERVEFEAETKHGDFDRVTHVIYVPDIGADGKTHGIFSLSLDITALKQVERQLIELARVDTLTGLPNRLAFNEYLPNAIARARRTGSALALMFLDVDRFKSINDTLGHASGDEVLAEFARRLHGSVRSSDMVARLAGDEFVIVLEDMNSQDAAALIAGKIVEGIREPAFQVDGQLLEVTSSIGVAFSRPGEGPLTAAELLAQADAALYNAKAAGRDRFAMARSAAHAA
ncbi:PAS domain S-box/diguanylate cyclase (GGDEF) domain-containing protein [Variovorax sp. WS11]|uniref:sensor domain-containing diguanylate cyclase n=2 Tax=Variovorax sp. WS11 TaxID=1105204 RepID=UPI000D0DC974|nr:PAS domain-containing protein [Variovorax sp. WS11]NDZ19025.1 PAS domain-containing protein [Variovorax sp. WS11]PSL85048.1 PAS domain S-box/diguanylate cyclase (GGDEF) domain-containing protein [Variovorax sp. WS11]